MLGTCPWAVCKLINEISIVTGLMPKCGSAFLALETKTFGIDFHAKICLVLCSQHVANLFIYLYQKNEDANSRLLPMKCDAAKAK